MLIKLDEFCGLVDMIRSDTALCLYRTMPEIQEKCKEIQVIFGKIDKLEAFVTAVKRNVSEVEDRVNKAEADMGSLSGIKKMLSSISIPSFMSPKKSANKQKTEGKVDKGLRFEALEIFETDRFFPASSHAPPAVIAKSPEPSASEGIQT
ncbi:biogenesis of lysosome-related organelles complex 1 subunit 4-like [Liolophura sinensis]|uniref:biogenesis of lysosome-related organelles complex 1 subunit 4-like n=1 Tax=Liolophura sinensis TaxID=3198878 RepID=UPI003158A537